MAEIAQLEYEKAVEDYNEEMVNLSIAIFLDETYEELKQKIPLSYAKQDYKEIKAIVHKFKTTAKYMGAFDFAELCGLIQKCVEEGKEDLIQLNILYSVFMKNLDALYEVCLNQNQLIHNKGKSSSIKLNNEEEDIKKDEDQIKEEEEEDNDDDNNNYLSAKNSLKKYFEQFNYTNSSKTPKAYRKTTYSFSDVVSSLNISSKTNLQKNKIQLRYEQAIHKFEAEIVNVIIQTFVTQEYKVMKENLKRAYESRDIKELQACLHTMKLKAKYICAEEFAEDCIVIENCIKENPEDSTRLTQLFPEFMADYDLLYAEVELCYNTINQSNIDYTPKIYKNFASRNKSSHNHLRTTFDSPMQQSIKKNHQKTRIYIYLLSFISLSLCKPQRI